MSDAWPSIKIQEFHHVVTGPSQSLLRVTGRGPLRLQAGARPALVIDDGERELRISPLEAPPDRGRTLRADYAVPSEVVAAARSYRLEHETGSRTPLPVPEPGVAGGAAGRSGADSPDSPEEARQRLAALEEAHAIALQAARRREAEAAARAVDSEERMAAAETRERETSQRLSEAQGELEALSDRARQAERTVQELSVQLADAERRLAEAVGARQPLEREVGDLRSRRVVLERDLGQTRDQLRLLTMERDELSRQTTALDELVVKHRQRAVQAEAASEKAQGALQEFQAWRSELQRRLATANGELMALREAREADQRELTQLRAALAAAEAGAGGSRPTESTGDGQGSTRAVAE